MLRPMRSLMLLLDLAAVMALGHTSEVRWSRRAAVGGALALALPPTAVYASFRAELLAGVGNGCTFGEGDGCEALAEGSPLILKLQRQSRENKEKNELEIYEKTNAMLGYDDYMIASDKVMVRIDPNGKFKALTTAEYYDAKKAGRISPGDNGIENLDFVATVQQQATQQSSYERVKEMLLADKLEGVIFKAPSGLDALAVAKEGDGVIKVSFDRVWKREELYNMCEKRKLPNNLKDVLAGNDVLAAGL